MVPDRPYLLFRWDAPEERLPEGIVVFMSDTREGAASARAKVPFVSGLARSRKLQFFFSWLAKDARILDVGCAEGWVKQWAVDRGYKDVVGIDVKPPADVVGDVRDWRALGLERSSFDAIVAFEVIEHGDISGALHDLLKPGGLLLATTPVPKMDWACRVMERIGALQRRTSPHSHLTDLRTVTGFEVVDHRVKGLVSQWGVLRAV